MNKETRPFRKIKNHERFKIIKDRSDLMDWVESLFTESSLSKSYAVCVTLYDSNFEPNVYFLGKISKYNKSRYPGF